jgi:hypothetical protein
MPPHKGVIGRHFTWFRGWLELPASYWYTTMTSTSGVMIALSCILCLLSLCPPRSVILVSAGSLSWTEPRSVSLIPHSLPVAVVVQHGAARPREPRCMTAKACEAHEPRGDACVLEPCSTRRPLPLPLASFIPQAPLSPSHGSAHASCTGHAGTAAGHVTQLRETSL